MLADSDYCTYFLIAVMQSWGVDVAFEQHGARKTDFRRSRPIGTRDHWMTWSKPSRPAWMSREAYEAFPDCLEVRGKILVTTLTPQEASKNELGALFAERWPVEVDLRNLKTTLGMEVLKCKTAEMCEKEKKSRYSESQILGILKQGDSGVPVPDLCREHGMSSATYYKWRAKYGGMDASLPGKSRQGLDPPGMYNFWY